MGGAVALLIVNAIVAGMFAASYFLIALIKRGRRRVYVFGISYSIGMVTPLSELAIHWTGAATSLLLLSHAALLGAFLSMAAAIAMFEEEKPRWIAIAVIGAVGVGLRISILGGPRDDLLYELLYQAPFASALALCALTTASHARGRPLHLFLTALFAIIALDFLLKPLVASALGSGKTAQEYAASPYAVFSQASTGILLIAAGLLVLIVVIQTTVQDYTHESETDHLSGLLNRRGFDRRAQRMLASWQPAHHDAAVIMIDLDHFKQINDRFGHDEGDRVIRSFADVLTQTVPRTALIARTGGDEFAILLDRTAITGGRLIAEAIRQQVGSRSRGGRAYTLSQGVAQYQPGDSLSDLMQRADKAAYRAKKSGRDKVECDDANWQPASSQNVVPLRAMDTPMNDRTVRSFRS